MTKNIVLFASGNGSNAERIIRHFEGSPKGSVKAVFCNKKDAYVLERAKNLGVPTVVFSREDLYESTAVIDKLRDLGTDLIVLAGFLWLVPGALIAQYPGKIINVHPALLPAYGGKGMYGSRVHEQVIHNGEKESGISIHYVNEIFDEGEVIFQARCSIEEGDTAQTLAAKIHELEHRHFPEIIEKLL